jgi:hypothetical protein
VLCTDEKVGGCWHIDPFVPDVAATTFRTLEQVLLSVGEQCSELEALHILPAFSYGCSARRLPLGDHEAAYTQLTRQCPRLVVLDLVIDHEVPRSLDISTLHWHKTLEYYHGVLFVDGCVLQYAAAIVLAFVPPRSEGRALYNPGRKN